MPGVPTPGIHQPDAMIGTKVEVVCPAQVGISVWDYWRLILETGHTVG